MWDAYARSRPNGVITKRALRRSIKGAVRRKAHWICAISPKTSRRRFPILRGARQSLRLSRPMAIAERSNDGPLKRSRSSRRPIRPLPGPGGRRAHHPEDVHFAHQAERFEIDKEAGLLEHEAENYVQHVWKRENTYTKKLISNVRAKTLETKPSFTKQRVFGTFFDGEKVGYSPVSKDIGFLFAAREHSANQAIAARAFIRSMLDGKASDGRPLVSVSGSGRPISEEENPAKAYLIDAKMKPEDIADYRPIDHPALRKWTWATNESSGKPIYVKGDMVVHPEAYTHLKNVLGRSALRSFALSQAILDVNATIKSSLALSFSGFHQTQESLHAISCCINPTSTKTIDFSSPKQAKLIDHGLQVASFDAQEEFSEGLASGLTERIPLVGGYLRRYNDYLFSDYIPRLKMAMAREALERNLKRYAGKMSEDQIYALTANQANAAFGELNYTMLGRNKTMQDVLRMALLAPDFLEARGRFVGQALKPYGREQAVALIAGALGL